MSRDGDFAFLASPFQCLSSLSVEKSFLMSNLNLPGKLCKEVWSANAGLTSLQTAPETAGAPVLSCVSITSSHPHIHAHSRFRQTRFCSTTFTDENLISSSERKEVDYGKFMCPSVGDVTPWLESAKSTEMFYNQSQTYSSLNEWRAICFPKKHLFCYTFFATAQRVTVRKLL